jgi:hypothetical protein
MPSVCSIEMDRIAGKQPGHDSGKRRDTCAQEQVGVIRQQRKGVAGGLCLRKDHATAIEKILPVIIIREYPPAFNATDNDVVEYTRCIESDVPLPLRI